jgi:hypothetical protein
MRAEQEGWKYRYSDEERKEIIDAAPSPPPDGIELDAEIRELEESAGIYCGVGESYRQRFKGKARAWEKAFERLDELVALAESDALVEIHQMLPGLSDAREHARLIAIGADMSAHSHRNNRSPETKQLYDQVRATYVKLGGKLAVSRPKGGSGGEPYGPAIRFFEAVLRPVMREDTPSPEGLAAIIKQRRNA